MTDPQSPRLARSHRVLLAVGIVALVALIAVGASLRAATESALSTAPTRTSTASPTPDAGTPGAGTPGAATPGEQLGPLAPLAAPTPVPTAGVRTSTEVEAAPPAASSAPDAPKVASLLPGGIPASKSALGALVAGFPAAVPIVDESTIVSSSITSSGPKVQATVVASTSRTVDDVLSLYTTAFAALGLAGDAVPSASGDTAVAFSRADSSVTLTITAAAKGSTYSLFAVIDAGS